MKEFPALELDMKIFPGQPVKAGK